MIPEIIVILTMCGTPVGTIATSEDSPDLRYFEIGSDEETELALAAVSMQPGIASDLAPIMGIKCA
jgi:hypothetical protein